jgi:hypothetical protein
MKITALIMAVRKARATATPIKTVGSTERTLSPSTILTVQRIDVFSVSADMLL